MILIHLVSKLPILESETKIGFFFFAKWIGFRHLNRFLSRNSGSWKLRRWVWTLFGFLFDFGGWSREVWQDLCRNLWLLEKKLMREKVSCLPKNLSISSTNSSWFTQFHLQKHSKNPIILTNIYRYSLHSIPFSKHFKN